MSSNTYSTDYIKDINSRYPWDNSIYFASTDMQKANGNPITYKLHATGGSMWLYPLIQL